MLPNLQTPQRLDRQIITPIVIIIFVICILNTISMITFLNRSVDAHMKETLDWIANVGGLATNISETSNRDLEDELDSQLETISNSLFNDFNRKNFVMNNTTLTELAFNYSLNGMYIIKNDGDRPFLAHSVNLKRWQDLISINPELTDSEFYSKIQNKGLTDGQFVNNVWISAYTQLSDGEYVKSSVAYDKKLKVYLISVVSGIESYQANNSTNSNKMIEDIFGSSQSIEEAAVIDIHDFINSQNESNSSSEENKNNHTTVYGRYTFAEKSDEDYLIALLKYKKSITVPFKVGENEWTKAYLPINDDQAAIVIFNDHSKKDLTKIVTWLSLISNLLVIIAVSFYVYILIQMRLKPIKRLEDHLSNVAEGDFTGRVYIKEGNELDSLGEIIDDMTIRMKTMIDKLNEAAAEDVRSTVQVYLENFESLMISIDSSRHDMRNHVNVLHGLILNEKYGEARSYMEEMYKELKEIDLFIQTKNPQVGTLIRTKAKVAKTNKTDFDVDIDNDMFDLVKQTDLIKILSNLIDNAMDAVVARPEGSRQVHVALTKKYQFYYEIVVTNNGPKIDDEIKDKIFERGFSTKLPKNSSHQVERGSGLAIIKNIVKNYNGEFSCRSTEDKTVFSVMLDLRENE
ncbi:ATP-binding protein [Paenibacillus sp. 276b]|uniref:ATP-binding protein n=1 Tax=Paenibacillus sp. 276b TaxID=1566277 RepID=UPI0008943BC6|nr:ATP-binding protein [Paenibacillus sp. 276b]SEB27483.1 Sensor_kinase_SpoOB-type, alpha-helical domain [Paenibacillus sp. 276b]